ncbi:unnamed protein product [Macrosiphum euphorbiae]|uniref:Reverse transcriptase domain-containing protein n=1 Tax=Macrosiphum euphorbiae TaxID=13131 RepID=A0AAV0WS00_9HEMI|nr:unnamed protein product [Macrosiphum euphorbiae]
MFESLVQKDILRSFNNIIMEEQHGFRPGRSTITNSLIFHNYCFNAFQHHSQVDVIYTDFNKAFDTITDTNGLNYPMLNLMCSLPPPVSPKVDTCPLCSFPSSSTALAKQ